MLTMIVVLVFVSTFLFIVAVGWTTPEATVQERLRAYGVAEGHTARLSQPFLQRVVVPFLGGIANFVARLAPVRLRSRAAERLTQAGFSGEQAATPFVFIQIALAVLLPLLVVGPLLLSGRPVGLPALALAAALFWLGARLPDFWLSRRIQQRRDEMTRALPDVIDIVTVCVEAGYGLDQAMAKVAERTEGPLTIELQRTLRDIALGKPRREALRDLAQRSGVPDLMSFVAAVVQADETGVSIAQVLRVQSDHLRIRRRQRAEELALEAPVKMLFPLVFCIFPAMMIVLMGPAFISIFTVLFNR